MNDVLPEETATKQHEIPLTYYTNEKEDAMSRAEARRRKKDEEEKQWEEGKVAMDECS